ncbi:MAG: sulfotransferase [Candidatus Limnocylindrales bacterium]
MTGRRLLTRVRNRAERLRQHRWRMTAYASGERHIIMGGAPRSGTTVLRKLFDRHPEICSGAETKLFVPAAYNLEWLARAYGLPLAQLVAMRDGSPSQAAFIDAFAARVREDAGKARWAEKTPQNIRHLRWINERFPQASIVHIIRDGRDVVCSMRQHPDWRWVDGSWRKVLVPRSVESYARRWLADVQAGIAWRDDPRYVEVRYEDLVADPQAVLRSICDGIGAGHDATWLSTVDRADAASQPEGEHTKRPDYEGALSTASVGRWRADLGADEQAEVERLCGPQLRELGYER